MHFTRLCLESSQPFCNLPFLHRRIQGPCLIDTDVTCFFSPRDIKMINVSSAFKPSNSRERNFKRFQIKSVKLSILIILCCHSACTTRGWADESGPAIEDAWRSLFSPTLQALKIENTILKLNLACSQSQHVSSYRTVVMDILIV